MINEKSLEALGWSRDLGSDPDENLARITAVHRSHLVGITINGELNVHYSGDFSQDPVAVGDWVVLSSYFVDEQKKQAATIKELIPRKSKISRVAAGEQAKEQVIAANVDIVFVVTSVNQDLSLNRLRRYLLLIKEGLARPVVVLSKTDLEPTHLDIMRELKTKIDDDTLVLSTSLVNKTGLEEIKSLIQKGCTSVFVGSSGVGKSSLVNFLLNEDRQTTNEVKKDDGKGKHTTTSRQMFFLPSGGMIIDTPGIKGVSVFGSEEALSETFEEVEDLLTQCKFSNCSHSGDPGCAVEKALSSKTLEQEKWDNYLKLSVEISENNSKLKDRGASPRKKKGRKARSKYKS